MRFDFKNASGEILSGSLEIPENKPRAFALFAHCFTCSKNIIAPTTISKELLEHDIAILRFDFTGLGNSEGDFANTNFSSNIEDLIAAYYCLEKKYEAPKIIIGHSLGGAAVLKAATLLKEISSVVTIGAPSDVKHVQHLFKDSIEEIKQSGKANVFLAGRPFTIRSQFIEDLNSTQILKEVKELRKSLLIMHSPTDETVSIDHAAEIYQAAKHPKSFISLDNADHLLMKKSDAKYAAGIIAAWADRYI